MGCASLGGTGVETARLAAVREAETVVTNIYNPRTQQVVAGGSEAQEHDSDVHAGLGSRPCLETKIWRGKGLMRRGRVRESKRMNRNRMFSAEPALFRGSFMAGRDICCLSPSVNWELYVDTVGPGLYL